MSLPLSLFLKVLQGPCIRWTLVRLLYSNELYSYSLEFVFYIVLFSKKFVSRPLVPNEGCRFREQKLSYVSLLSHTLNPYNLVQEKPKTR